MPQRRGESHPATHGERSSGESVAGIRLSALDCDVSAHFKGL